MKYLLDTDVIVDHLRRRRELDPLWFEVGCGIGIISKAELFYGVEKSRDQRGELDKMSRMLEEWEIEVVGLDETSAREYGRIKARLERKGQRVDEFDLLIAATAISHNLILVTRNRKHFERIPGLVLAGE